MSALSDEFNKIWPDLPYGKARQFRVFMEVSRVVTRRKMRLTTKDGGSVPLDRLRDFTLWELRLAEIIVDRMKSEIPSIFDQEIGRKE